MGLERRNRLLPEVQINQRLSVEAAAAYVGLSASTLNKLRVFGGGPAFLKLGRRVVYDVRDLDQWLSDRRRQSTSEA
ncbi:MAG: hypothetical protein JWR84_1700 [Caulobacter sp.]|nr:hypothetical protein [Caulobacter sp.]